MYKLEDFLNKRYSLRNINDLEFENVCNDLAHQLINYNYKFNYEDRVLARDWGELCRFENFNNIINSSIRCGMKISEHFMPNFWSIKNSKGKSFENQWTIDNLKKVLVWNRKSHSTPYMSELRRGVYFCLGLTKNTMFRPQLAKLICNKYKPDIVLDPCAGWGGRLLGTVAHGAKYIAFEPNTTTYDGLQALVKFCNIQDRVQLICDDARNMHQYDFPQVDMVLTSPPYFDVEIYTKQTTQSITNCNTYDEWATGFLKNIIDQSLSRLNKHGVSCWNVGKVGSRFMQDDVAHYHQQNMFTNVNEFSVISSKRQALQTTDSKKSADVTVVYQTCGYGANG